MKERLKGVTKSRAVASGVVTVLLLGISIGTVWGEGLQGGKLILALFLSVFAGVAILVNSKLDRLVGVLLMFFLPFCVLSLVEFYTHVPWDLTIPIMLLNYLFYLLLYILAFAVFGSSLGFALAPVLPMLFGLVNYFVVSFRSSPIVPWDVYSIGTAVTVTDNYEFSISYRLAFVLIGFVWVMIIGEKTAIRIKPIRVRILASVMSVVLIGGYVSVIQIEKVQDAFGMDDILFTPNVLYRNNGLTAAFMANLRYLNVQKPKGYSVKSVEEIVGQNQQTGAETVEKKPNIIVIMNEAFSDLSVYGDFGVSEDYMPYIRSLTEDTVKGNLYVSVKGGNTANTEFEFLTGNSMAFMPNGSVPYQQFMKGDMPSLASQLGSLGYVTTALHPYNARGWNRNTVYPQLGFDQSYFKDDFPNATTLRGYVDDKSAFEKVIELYEEKEADDSLFAFEVTMQNHGGYSKEYEDLEPEIFLTDVEESKKGTQIRALEKYLTLIKITDDEFQNLTEYFAAQDEETIILMFGDHQPSDYICNPVLRTLGISENAKDESAEAFAKGYTVPFVMWANYDIEEKEVAAISANYLGGLLMETAELPLTGYQEYLAGLRKVYPAVTANFYMDESGTIQEYSGDVLRDYAILQYNNVVDNAKRVPGFFDSKDSDK